MSSENKKLKESVRSFSSLRSRVERLFSVTELARDPRQRTLDLFGDHASDFTPPTKTLSGFIDFLSAAVPSGEVYLFGGVLRDMALHGRRGFSSDIDIVVEGDWKGFVRYLEKIGAKRNKFGGYRLFAGDWPIDVWNAEETWAIRKGIVHYDGIASLTKTTVLNWDAILMNWRTKSFVCDALYLDFLRDRVLDIVLEENPNPLGMAVRVFRHLSLKDAKKIGSHAAQYLEFCTERYSFDDLISSEIGSYRNSFIDPSLYRFFSLVRKSKCDEMKGKFEDAVLKLRKAGIGPSWQQLDLLP